MKSCLFFLGILSKLENAFLFQIMSFWAHVPQTQSVRGILTSLNSRLKLARPENKHSVYFAEDFAFWTCFFSLVFLWKKLEFVSIIGHFRLHKGSLAKTTKHAYFLNIFPISRLLTIEVIRFWFLDYIFMRISLWA